MKRLSTVLIVAAVLAFSTTRLHAQEAIITTVAGNGTFDSSGDDGPATSASFRGPTGVAIDGGGNLFIIEFGLITMDAPPISGRIRRVDAGADGQVTGAMDESTTTVAGNGTWGFGGDGGHATSASFRIGTVTPNSAVVLDSAGNLFIADFDNDRIRRVDAGADGQVTGAADEIITTVAGNGARDFTGDGGPATSASLHTPLGVAMDSGGNLFIADAVNSRIRRVDAGADGQVTGAADEIITTVAGNGARDFTGDGGPATSASLSVPVDLAVGAGGNLFIADHGNNRIRRVGPSNQPPVANAGVDQTEECSSPDGASITLDGSGSSDPDGDGLTFEWTDSGGNVVGTTETVNLTMLPLGVHTLTLTVDDGNGGTATDSVKITVQDTTPPTLSFTLSPDVIRSHNHKLVAITADIQVSDTCDTDPSIDLVSIISSEPDDGLGDGDTPDDIQGESIGTADQSFSLRAERGGVGTGRIYTVKYRAMDASGNMTFATGQVTVPHDQSGP